jgi:hypothetical protein
MLNAHAQGKWLCGYGYAFFVQELKHVACGVAGGQYERFGADMLISINADAP